MFASRAHVWALYVIVLYILSKKVDWFSIDFYYKECPWMDI